MSAELVAAVREGAGLFALSDRSVVRVGGRDARRWLNGMVTNDVEPLEHDGPTNGCRTLLLTPIGRIASDLLVVARPDGFWLDLPSEVRADTVARLEKYVIADDVTLEDTGTSLVRFAVEGPAAREVAEAARDALDEAGVVAFAFGLSGGPGVQLFVPAEARETVRSALLEAGAGHGLVEADDATLEVLRVEEGEPRLGAELDEEVLPPEARLDSIVSTTKGCYTGQEVIARIASRGQVKHLLVGLTLEGDALPSPGDAIEVDGRAVGEVTSAVRSPAAGAIALGFVKRPHESSGTAVRAGGLAATVVDLPFAGRRA